MADDFIADVPGRGAWRLTGGLLPVTPGASGEYGFYRKAALGEVWIGSPWALGADESHTAHVINLGVRAIQRLVGLTGDAVDGWFGNQTSERVIAAQTRLRVVADGIVGPSTMRALLLPTIQAAATRKAMPLRILGGLLVFESGLDPAAVGTNGYDTGLGQINLSVHGATVNLEQALDAPYAINWAATNIRSAYDRFAGRTTADPWDVAIAWHNSPVAATAWARAGAPQYDPDRSIQIADYVAQVKAAW